MNVFEQFFGTSPHKLVRRDDPETSHEAANTVDTTRLESMVYEAIKKAGSKGIISDDVQKQFPNLPYSSVTARYRALLDKGFIEIIGKRLGRSGRNQRIMRAAK